MLRIFFPTERSARDILSDGTIHSLHRQGIDCSVSELWPRELYAVMNSGKIPFGRTIFRQFMAGSLATQKLSVCQTGDIAWILSFCSPCVTQPRTEQLLAKRGVQYVFHVMDDWFEFDWLRQGTILRCRLADLVVVPTPQLADRVREFCANADIAVLEEPIDIERLKPDASRHLATVPTILWNGNPFNLDNISFASSAMVRLSKKINFTLRVICEKPPPRQLALLLNVEWAPFDHTKEREHIHGCWFGIAPMPDTGHNRCKGAYKVKTYCASGLPVVASPVGFQADLIREGAGIGFLPETPEEWEQSLLRLLTDRNLCLSMGQKARAYAEKRFSYEAVAPQWANTLRNHFGSHAFEQPNASTERIGQPCAG